MRKEKWVSVWAVLPALVVSMLAAGAVAQAGQPASSKPVTSTATSLDGKAVDSAAATDSVAAYWTPERMAGATPADIPADKSQPSSRAEAKPNGPAGSIAGSAPASRSANDVGILLNDSQTVGKVYFYDPAGMRNRTCSGAVVNSGKKRLVQTAGHCVHGGAGRQWMQNWVFVPRYRYGSQPYGVWSARQLTAQGGWINNSNHDVDMGIAIMNDQNGQRIANVLGSNGLRWNWGYSVSVTVLGYAADPPFDGGQQYVCQGTTWNGHQQQVRIWCNMTGGSSGGPWLQEYNDQNGIGFINSVVSHRHGDANQMDGPYFDDDIKVLYDYAESLSPA
jgi:V8-like Glu-specific endopeptidase